MKGKKSLALSVPKRVMPHYGGHKGKYRNPSGTKRKCGKEKEEGRKEEEGGGMTFARVVSGELKLGQEQCFKIQCVHSKFR